MPLHLETFELSEAERAIPALAELVAWHRSLPSATGAVRFVEPGGALGLNSELMLISLPDQYQAVLDELVGTD